MGLVIGPGLGTVRRLWHVIRSQCCTVDDFRSLLTSSFCRVTVNSSQSKHARDRVRVRIWFGFALSASG